MSKTAIFSPGPSYSDPRVREMAGWVGILDLYRQGLEELGFEVFIPHVDEKLIDRSSTVSKILSYDILAADQIRGEGPSCADLFLGPPGYSLVQMNTIGETTERFLYVWNNADWWRDKQLAEEYERFNAPYELSPTWRWINRTALERCDHVIACSPWVKWTHWGIVSGTKISITPWGVDSVKFHPGDDEPPGFRILFVGGDPIRKGLYYLMRALDRLKDYELWIVGCSPFADPPPPNWKQFGMLPHSHIPEIYRQVHVLVCPTLEDGIALCVQEAMASGLPIITSPETAEVMCQVEPGKVEQSKIVDCGFVVGYRDINAIKSDIVWLMEHPEERRKMGRAARAVAEKQTWEITKEEFKEVVKEVMRG